MPSSEIDRAFAHIESIGTAGQMGFLNDVAYIAHYVRSDPEMHKLENMSQVNPDVGTEICNRISRLLRVNDDPTSVHLYDRAIATYLVILYLSNQEALRHALTTIYIASADYPNLSWTFSTYNRLLAALPRRSTLSGASISPDYWQPSGAENQIVKLPKTLGSVQSRSEESDAQSNCGPSM